MSSVGKINGKRVRNQCRSIFFSLSLLGVVFLQSFSAQAQTRSLPVPSQAPLELNLLEEDALPSQRGVITADTISPNGLTIPSLWWAKEQFAGKLLNNWLAYPQERRVDLVVNRQLWTILDYIDRYSFVNEFGTVARDYGYNVRVFNVQKRLLAAYTCDYSLPKPDCDIWVETSGQDSLRVRPQL